MSILRSFALSAAALWLLALPALSQDEEKSASQIEGLFQQHLNGTGLTRSITSPTKTLHRGLVIVPATGDTPETLKDIEFEAVDPEMEVSLKILFDLDSYVLREDQTAKLMNVCTAMLGMNDTAFRIIGHTDASGSEAHNDKLSVQRAEEIRSHMVDICGVESNRLQAVGVGERYLRDTDKPISEINRRVEFQAIGALES